VVMIFTESVPYSDSFPQATAAGPLRRERDRASTPRESSVWLLWLVIAEDHVM
jgi:hypothetical protein